MKNARMLAFALVLCASAFAQKGQFAVPEGTDMEHYPILTGPVTPRQMALMHLHASYTEKEVVVENHYRNLRDKLGRFVLEKLPSNTLVYKDELEKIRYKADCGNRLVEIVPTPVVTPPTPVVNTGSSSGSHQNGGGKIPTWWDKMTDGLKSAAKGIWGTIGNILEPLWWLFLAILGILLACAALIALLIGLDKLFSGWRNPPSHEPIPPIPSTPTSYTRPTGTAPQEAPAEKPATTAAASTDGPTAPTGKRSFLSFAKAGEGNANMLRYQGMDVHHYERGADGVNTIRFTHHQ